MKMGRTPRASTATKRGTKHKRKIFIVRDLPYVAGCRIAEINGAPRLLQRITYHSNKEKTTGTTVTYVTGGPVR
jgi:hypothetical protein